MSVDIENLPENDATLPLAMRLWHALDRKRQLDESGKYFIGAAYDPEVRIIESHLTELEQLRAGLAALVDALPVCQHEHATCGKPALYGNVSHEPDMCEEHRRPRDHRACQWIDEVEAALRLLGRER